jgi:glycosyltransferase involved in cell wall biosynthesis
MKRKLLSVIVPAYKQERTILRDLQNIDKTLRIGLPKDMTYEIICVVDGILDKTVIQAKKTRLRKVHVLAYEENRGKGYAVRYGMMHARGDLISFLDAGREIKPKGIMMLLAHMDWYNADIIVGSKRHPVSHVNYPLARKILSTGYHLMVKATFGLPITDTQSGIKVFKRKVIRKIIPYLTVERYAMDIEMLAAAKSFGFSRMYEAPIEVHFDKKTSGVKWSTSLKMAFDTIKVFTKLRLGNYSNVRSSRFFHQSIITS